MDKARGKEREREREISQSLMPGSSLLCGLILRVIVISGGAHMTVTQAPRNATLAEEG